VAARSAKDYLISLQIKLERMPDLGHLRVRARGAVLTLESGPTDDPWPHVRFRRDTVHLWLVEMPARGGRWNKTPFRGELDELVDMVAETFPWTLQDWSNTERTSDLDN